MELIRQLAAMMTELSLFEIEVTSGELRVRLQRGAAAPAAVTDVSTGQTGVAAVPTVTIEAPMVGTFYRASSPSAEPYVREGDLVKQGQILGIIEAMKLMNEIESKVSGRIVTILVDNGQPVEYGQPLVLIDPDQ